ncbi:hypothetical protein NDR87_20710 [Nocardia sp. CDC159]|uniref:N-acetyltransferase domain-containing protein n=1 Tax=Nocardia pulmonis TaxID=2951408 RepID=A0A9X2EDS1_9NOCA|nr:MULTISPECIES: hypothetical protein [Nocardia]MCM6776368.1 hypothetical protein [Nocardia pulmonis]MCM6788792.1 hypothetical protein [Nocardia sp. CDC159]
MSPASWAAVPARLYAHSPAWVQPIRSDALALLKSKQHPFRRQAWFEHFVLMDDDRAVGRVVATVHRSYIERHGENIGYFGFLDAPVERRYFEPLLRTAEDWLANRGMDVVAGPYNYWSGQEMGLLTKGFDARPTVFQTWNPPGYRELLEELGYRKRADLTSYRISRETIRQLMSRLQRLGARITDGRAADLTVRRMRGSAVVEDLELVRLLFNRTFADNHEIVAYDRETWEFLVHPIRKLLDPDLVLFVQRGDEPLGMIFMAPDLNRIIAALDGRLRLWDYPKVVRARRSIDTAVVLVLGVVPEAPPGTAARLLWEAAEILLNSKYTSLETTWVHESNRSFDRGLRAFGDSRDHKHWVLMEKDLVRTP